METSEKQSVEIAKIIHQQLMGTGATRVWSWGANSWTAVPNGLLFKVQGFLFKGHVLITLLPNDTYTIQLIKSKKIFKEFADVYFDEMVNLIDSNVEYTGVNYEDDVNKTAYKF